MSAFSLILTGKSVDPFGQVEGRCEVSDLTVREGNFLHPVGARIQLLDRDTFGENIDGNILHQRGGLVIDECDDCGVEFMLDGKHMPSLPPGRPR